MPTLISWAKEHGIDARHMIFLRDPVSHVLSMFNHCLTAKYSSHRCFDGNLTHWLISAQDGNKLCCYPPRNLMVRYLSEECERDSDLPFDGEYVTMPSDLMQAKQRLRNETFFFGLTEYYAESLCLLQFKVDGSVPDKCDCRSPDLTESMDVAHVDHGSSHTSLSSLSQVEQRAIQDLTGADLALYQYAVQLFRQEIQLAEAAAGFPILGSDCLSN